MQLIGHDLFICIFLSQMQTDMKLIMVVDQFIVGMLQRFFLVLAGSWRSKYIIIMPPDLYVLINWESIAVVATTREKDDTTVGLVPRDNDDDVRFYCRYGITMMMIDMTKQLKYAYINFIHEYEFKCCTLYSHTVQV